MLRLVWADSLPTAVGPALIDVPEGMVCYGTRAMESSRETHSIQNCLLARLGSFNLSAVRKGEREGRGESGQDRYQCVITPRKGKCWLRPGFDSNWQNLFKCSLLTLRHQAQSTTSTDTCTHTIKENCPPTQGFHSVFSLDFPTLQAPKCPLKNLARAQLKNTASYMLCSWSKCGYQWVQ